MNVDESLSLKHNNVGTFNEYNKNNDNYYYYYIVLALYLYLFII